MKLPREAVRIPSFNGYYITPDGDVYSARKRKILKMNPVPRKTGHKQVGLCVNGGQRITCSIGRLMLTTFLGPPPEKKPFALHRNGDPTWNHISNLYWGSQKDNMQDAIRHGTFVRNTNAKINENTVRDIRRDRAIGMSYKDLSKKYVLSISTLGMVIGRYSWKHIKDWEQ